MWLGRGYAYLSTSVVDAIPASAGGYQLDASRLWDVAMLSVIVRATDI